jgi:hypothetical protein
MSRETTQSRYKFTCESCGRSTFETFTDGGYDSPSNLPQGWLSVLRDGRAALDFCSDRCAALACLDHVEESPHRATQTRPRDEFDRLAMKHRLRREDPAAWGMG